MNDERFDELWEALMETRPSDILDEPPAEVARRLLSDQPAQVDFGELSPDTSTRDEMGPVRCADADNHNAEQLADAMSTLVATIDLLSVAAVTDVSSTAEYKELLHLRSGSVRKVLQLLLPELASAGENSGVLNGVTPLQLRRVFGDVHAGFSADETSTTSGMSVERAVQLRRHVVEACSRPIETQPCDQMGRSMAAFIENVELVNHFDRASTTNWSHEEEAPKPHWRLRLSPWRSGRRKSEASPASVA